MAYTDKQLDFIIQKRESGMSWEEVAEAYTKKFEKKSSEAVRGAYNRVKITQDIGHEEADLQLLQHNRAVRRTNYRLRKEANTALDALTIRDSILEEINKAIENWPLKRSPPPPLVTSPHDQEAVVELLIGDTHFGAKTNKYNFNVARKRIREILKVAKFKIDETQKRYKINKIVLGLLGDIIASYEFHGISSAVAAEAVTPIQIVKAIEILFWELIHPLAVLGFKMEIPAVCGNHDRTSKDKPMNEPGNESISYIIYSSLEMLAKSLGLTNVTFIIPEKSYCIVDVFGRKVLFEHGDRGMRLDRRSAEQKINDRQSQLKEIISFFRFGHFHEYAQYGWGRCIANASLVGPDGYSDNMGFATEAGQVLSVYVNTKNRKSPFYYSFMISVEDIT